MTTLLIVLHCIFCVFLILVILLQTGKGAGMGAAFGGGSQTVFGPRGAGSFIGKVTAIVAVLFMLTSIVLAKISSSQRTGIADKVAALNEIRAAEVEEVELTGKSEEAAAAVGADAGIDLSALFESDGGPGDAGAAAETAPKGDAGTDGPAAEAKPEAEPAEAKPAEKPGQAKPETKLDTTAPKAKLDTTAPKAKAKEPKPAAQPAKAKPEQPKPAVEPAEPKPEPKAEQPNPSTPETTPTPGE